MKKVLLSLSMLAAVAVANAQNFKIWDATTGTGFMGAGTPYIFTPGLSNFVVDTANAAPYVITASGTAGSNCGQTQDQPCYYLNGFGNGSYAENGSAQAWGYSATNFATDKFFMNVNAPNTKIKIQFGIIGSADKYGYEFDLSTVTANAYIDQSVLLSSFRMIVADNPTGANLTSTLAASISSIEIVHVKTDGGGVGASSMKFKNMTIGTSSVITSTSSAAANIASTKIFPNPTSGEFTAEISLKNNANVTVIVTDMMGKQVATKSTTNGSASFETAGLAKGMYTVTYVLDGTPAKTELVVVK